MDCVSGFGRPLFSLMTWWASHGERRMRSYIFWSLLGMVGFTTLFTKLAERSGGGGLPFLVTFRFRAIPPFPEL